jgi:ABC-type sugar transport system ATPase subunit
MVGRELGEPAETVREAPGRVLLAVHGLARRPAFDDVSLEARAGEIVGVAGLVGAGRTETMRAILGIDRPDAGRVAIDGCALPPGNPRAAIAAGLGFVPESRKEQGLFLNLSVRENLALPHGHTSGPGLLRLGREREAARAAVRDFGVVTSSLEQGIGTLSGGNQQKVILARWLALDPKVLIVDEPTRGIDVGAKREIYDLLRAQAAAGRAVVVVSSELPEVLELATRVIVMRAGRIAGELSRAEASEDSIGRLAVGI